ncbi:hypothetical protein [Sphingomonas sp. HMP6]|uniref:hypothetical protein n=1 Tax=Sphingomonas sp. HMP6 TaxID=1517551 RepID=UPI00159642DC|nr:hypothetical protein [Sphingomonas sp. HMP6]BCA57718.1 hypothetical protein HMP06_0487 [Sphingomonas sp. HMP6]
MRAMFAGATASGWTLHSISVASGVSCSTIKGWLLEGKEPTLSRALSVALVIGRRAINSINALAGYGGATPFEETAGPDFVTMIPGCLEDLSIIAAATARGGLDHTGEPAARAAADRILARLLPISSAGQAE